MKRFNQIALLGGILLCGCMLVPGAVFAGDPPRFYQMTESQAASALQEIHKSTPELPVRIAKISEGFLGTPYKLGPLGEGPRGQFDRDPIMDLKQVDCTTLVEQVMAMALEPDMKKAVKTLQKIRYKNGDIRFETRNHFTSADWIPNDAAAGYLKDITREIGGNDTQVVSKVIKKKAWYQSRMEKDLEGFKDLTPDKQQELVKKWRDAGRTFPDQEIKLEYIPLAQLPALAAKIPSGTIANLIREDKEDMPDVVSHQIFIIEKDGQKFVRHAASSGAVEELPILAYFYRYFNSKWRLLGLNLNEPRDPRNVSGKK